MIRINKGGSMSRTMFWFAGFLALALAGPASAVDLCGKLDKKTGEVKSGSGVKFRTECATKKDGTPTEAPVGPVVSFADVLENLTVQDTDTEATKLSDPTEGGALEIATSARIVLNGAVTIANNAGTGEFSVIICRIQVSDGGAPFADVGVEGRTESKGDSNHDEHASIALVAVIDRPAGTYDARIVCIDDFASAGSLPAIQTAALSVTATPH
jgi:hypothetical protein